MFSHAYSTRLCSAAHVHTCTCAAQPTCIHAKPPARYDEHLKKSIVDDFCAIVCVSTEGSNGQAADAQLNLPDPQRGVGALEHLPRTESSAMSEIHASACIHKVSRIPHNKGSCLNSPRFRLLFNHRDRGTWQYHSTSCACAYIYLEMMSMGMICMNVCFYGRIIAGANLFKVDSRKTRGARKAECARDAQNLRCHVRFDRPCIACMT
jgi:hypothetical protein